MELFHVSCKNYKVGELIISENFKETEYYKESESKNMNWIDDFLDSTRPEGYPKRQSSLFAFDCIDNCFAFIDGPIRRKGIKYYKVKMNNPIGCPMCLTDSLVQDDYEHNTKIAKEYWSPKEDWKFMEYLSNSMEIIEILEDPIFEEKIKGKFNYNQDYQKRKKL